MDLFLINICLPFFLLYSDAEVKVVYRIAQRIGRYIDLFVIYSDPAFAVEGGFDHPFLAGQYGFFGLFGYGASATGLNPGNDQWFSPRILKPVFHHELLSLGYRPEIPGSGIQPADAGELAAVFWKLHRNSSAIFLIPRRTGEEQTTQDSI